VLFRSTDLKLSPPFGSVVVPNHHGGRRAERAPHLDPILRLMT
jgi:hypothetical protein